MGDAVYIDKEYALLEMLSENEEMSQRQLSRRLDISLGSVNMLINKMQRDGLIKFKNVSANSIAYMLTPEGIAEKAKKTYRYVTFHYKRINETKEKIKTYLENRAYKEENIYLVLDDSEMSEIVLLVLREMPNAKNIEVLEKNIIIGDSLCLLLKTEDKERFKDCKTEMLLEML